MRVTQRTIDNLVIEEAANTNLLIGSVMFAFGAAGISIGWIKGEPLIVVIALEREHT